MQLWTICLGPKERMGELELTFQVKKEKQINKKKISSGLSSYLAQSNLLSDVTAGGIPGSVFAWTLSLCYGNLRFRGEQLLPVVPRAELQGCTDGLCCCSCECKATKEGSWGVRQLATWGTTWSELRPRSQPVPGRGITTEQDGLTQGGSALRKLSQLLLRDLSQPG